MCLTEVEAKLLSRLKAWKQAIVPTPFGSERLALVEHALCAWHYMPSIPINS